MKVLTHRKGVKEEESYGKTKYPMKKKFRVSESKTEENCWAVGLSKSPGEKKKIKLSVTKLI